MRGDATGSAVMIDSSGILWLVIDVAMVAALAGALIYGIVMWRRRSRNPVVEQAREDATRRLYRGSERQP
jgi:hypothetical protein